MGPFYLPRISARLVNTVLRISAYMDSTYKILPILVALLLISGCSSSPDNEQLEGEADDSVTTSAESVESEIKPESSGVLTPELVADSQLSWNSYVEAVSDIPRYRREITLQFEPDQSAGASAPWKVDSIYTFNSSPMSIIHEINFEGEGAIEDFQSITISQQNENHYLLIPDNGCLTISAEEFSRMNSGIVDPDNYLAELTMPKLINTGEIVNGQETNHFSLDQNSLSGFAQQGLTVDGHLFVSKERGTPLLVTMEISGDSDFLMNGQREQGTLYLEIRLDELYERIKGDPGLGCIQSAPFPIADDAYEVTVLDELIAYKTRLPMQDLISFYSSELTPLGWEFGEEPAIIEQVAVLTFLRGEDELVIELETDSELEAISVLIAP